MSAIPATTSFGSKKSVAKVGQAAGKMLMDVLTNVATEAVKIYGALRGLGRMRRHPMAVGQGAGAGQAASEAVGENERAAPWRRPRQLGIRWGIQPMTQYDKALICVNGHLINSGADADPDKNSAFCPQCGAATITACSNCNQPIRGDQYDDQFDGVEFVGPHKLGFRSVPGHCHACGKSYPWTQSKAEALGEMIEELDGLSDDEREKLKVSIPDILADTPKSETAALRFKKAITKVGQAGGKMLMDVLTNVATEAVKKAMGL